MVLVLFTLIYHNVAIKRYLKKYFEEWIELCNLFLDKLETYFNTEYTIERNFYWHTSK